MESVGPRPSNSWARGWRLSILSLIYIERQLKCQYGREGLGQSVIWRGRHSGMYVLIWCHSNTIVGGPYPTFSTCKSSCCWVPFILSICPAQCDSTFMPCCYAVAMATTHSTAWLPWQPCVQIPWDLSLSPCVSHHYCSFPYIIDSHGKCLLCPPSLLIPLVVVEALK